MSMEKTFIDLLNAEIANTQAEIDDIELFGGDSTDLETLKITLEELQRERNTERARVRIVLENGNAITPTTAGAWGRMHFVSYAQGPRGADQHEQHWTCSLCGQLIHKGDRHFRRSYYLDKSDNRTGRQARLCEACADLHEADFPALTTFPVFRPAKTKTATRRPQRIAA